MIPNMSFCVDGQWYEMLGTLMLQADLEAKNRDILATALAHPEVKFGVTGGIICLSLEENMRDAFGMKPKHVDSLEAAKREAAKAMN